MNRQEKEEYLVSNFNKLGIREDTTEFRDGVAESSDQILDINLESLNLLIKMSKIKKQHEVGQGIESCKVCGSTCYDEDIEVRTTSANDNTSEYMKDEDCVEDNNFIITVVDGSKLQLEYKDRIGDIVINPISECRRLNYCFECGRKL